MPSASFVIDAGKAGAAGRHGLRYLAGAGLCAVISNAILIGGDAAGLPLLAGVLLSWLGGGLAGYLWHSGVTYREPFSAAACLRFLTGALGGIPLAWAALWLTSEGLGWPMWLAAPAATVALFCYHYLNALVAIRWRRLVRSGTPSAAPQP